MAYDERLAERVREVMGARTPFDEIKMFGGLCFTTRGRMAVGVTGEELMVRVGPEAHERALAKPGARLMDFTGKPMKGFLFVDAEGIKTKRALDGWVGLALSYVETLPPKPKRKKMPSKRPVKRATASRGRR